MNFNYNSNSTINVNKGMISDVIKSFGIEVVLIGSTMQADDIQRVLGDKEYDLLEDSTRLFVLPEDTAGFDENNLFSKFGITNISSTEVFVLKDDIDSINFIEDFRALVGCVVQFPSSKLMEINNIELYNEGINNMYLYNSEISTYKLSLGAYNINRNDVVEDTEYDFSTLDDVFSTEESVKNEIEDVCTNNDISTVKTNPFGDLG